MKHWQKMVVTLAISTTTLVAAASAAPLEQELGALGGKWQGEAADGTKLSLSMAAGSGNVLATGSWKVEGSALQGETSFLILRADSGSFLVPSTALFSSDSGQEAFVLSRITNGTLRFARLVRTSGTEPAVTPEEIIIARHEIGATAGMKVKRGERLCKDDTLAGGKACSPAVEVEATLSKLAP